MHAESCQVNIIAIADFMEKLSIRIISHNTSMTKQRDSDEFAYPTPSKNKE